MKSIESQAEEYAEALNDIADVLGLPTGSTSAQIAQAVENRWARGVHSCHTKCTRQMCVLRRIASDYLKAAVQYQCSPWDLRVVRTYGIAKARMEEILSENV